MEKHPLSLYFYHALRRHHNDIKRRTVGGGLKKKPVETDPMRRVLEEDNDIFGGGSIFNKDYSAVKELEEKARHQEWIKNKGV